jgi:hypothetical protein
MTTQESRSLTIYSFSQSSFWRWSSLFVIPLLYLTLAPVVRAVSPPPDGGYANETTAEGQDALFSLTTGFGNTALGYNALFTDTTGANNTAVGTEALLSDTSGGGNTGIGFQALTDNSTGIQNVAVGSLALTANTTGGLNTACGTGALFFNTTGGSNVACGASAMEFNKTGGFNTAVGTFSLSANSSGTNNTATGFEALGGNTIGFNNTAIGYQALESNSSGNYNTAGGQGALKANTTGTNNAALGQNALIANTTGSNNVAIGSNAGFNLTTGSFNIDIGVRGIAGESQTIRLGKTQTATFIAGISGATVSGGIGVIIDSNGHLGTITSSARFKENIQPMDKTSEAILSLEPVTFCYKKELDPKAIPQFGLVAEQVEKVNPDLVARDDQGKPYSVRYEAVNAMLLNEFLKEHRKVEMQSSEIAELKSLLAEQRKSFESRAAQQEKEISALAGAMERVSERLETTSSAPRVVTNN